MANKAISIASNIAIRYVDLGDGTHAIATKAVTVGSAMAANDKAIDIFGINKPIRLVYLNDGVNGAGGTHAIATATATTPKPAADLAASIFGVNIPVRLVALGDGTYALAVSAQ